MKKEDNEPRGYKVGYARVSSEDQNFDRQFEAFKNLGLNKIFFEKVQGDKADQDRPELMKFLDYLESGDTAYFSSFDRLSRKNLRLLSLIEEIKSKGVSLHFIEERIYLSPTIENPYDELNANIFAAFSDFFKKQLKLRQKAGIKAAKEKKPDLYPGRKSSLSLTIRKNILRKIILKKASYAQVQARYKISRATAWRVAYKDESLAELRQECLKLRYENELKKLAQKKPKT